MQEIPPCAVSGTGGYVGGAIARRLEALGVSVRRLTRAAGYSLAEPPPPSAFRDHGVCTLIHCAYDFSAVAWNDIRRLNVDGSLRLFDAARRGGVTRIVFVSSLAAYDGCVSLYGRGKRLVEHAVLQGGGHVVRPGTVFGPAPRGMMGALTNQVSSRRWVPVIQHPRSLRLVHEDDLASTVVMLAAEGPSPAVWLASGSRAWTLAELIGELARRSRRDIRLLPVPWRLVWAGLAAAERVGQRPSFRSDSVLSLAHPVPPDQLAGLRIPAQQAFRDF